MKWIMIGRIYRADHSCWLKLADSKGERHQKTTVIEDVQISWKTLTHIKKNPNYLRKGTVHCSAEGNGGTV